jgi:hypothetical protein
MTLTSDDGLCAKAGDVVASSIAARVKLDRIPINFPQRAVCAASLLEKDYARKLLCQPISFGTVHDIRQLTALQFSPGWLEYFYIAHLSRRN